MVGVFDATIADLTKRMKKHDVLFTIVADESYAAFESNGDHEIVCQVHVGLPNPHLRFFKQPLGATSR